MKWRGECSILGGVTNQVNVNVHTYAKLINIGMFGLSFAFNYLHVRFDCVWVTFNQTVVIFS